MAKTKSRQEEALQFLDDLDSLSPDGAQKQGVASVKSNQPTNTPADAAEALAFIDEITQKSSEPTKLGASYIDRPISRAGTPSVRKSTERVRVGTPSLRGSGSNASLTSKLDTKTKTESPLQGTNDKYSPSGSWGWGSVWSSASAAIQQARTAAEEQVKNLPNNEQARKWGDNVIEFAKKQQLDKFGQDFKRVGLSTLTDILNVVAPPISEHEVIQVWLSHDMIGYDGIETLVYTALARIMEQVEGGDLIVNRGEASHPKASADDSSRNLNAVDGYDAALRLAQANLDELIKNAKPSASSTTDQNPTTHSYVYMRVQPFITSLGCPKQAQPATEDTAAADLHLHFMLHLLDPSHNLNHTTVTQPLPASWIKIWDHYDWVEDLVAETLRVGVEVLGQEYVVERMGWNRNDEDAAAPSEVAAAPAAGGGSA